MKPVAGLLVWFLLMVGAAGHHGPEEVIAELTQQLERSPDDVDLLGRRATEYRALGRTAEAEADLRRVLKLDPESGVDMESLARVLWAQGKRVEAMRRVRTAGRLMQSKRDRAAVLILQSEWELEGGQLNAALATCRAAFQVEKEAMVDWYLLRSRIQELLGNGDERVAGLKAGQEALGSVVLRNAWVDASLDVGMTEEIAPVIEGELAKSRLKSSWWIRRGRLRLEGGEPDAGREDLLTAISELNRRIHPQRPDAKLLIDRAWAMMLLGDEDEARGDLGRARKHGADPWDAARLAVKLGE